MATQFMTGNLAAFLLSLLVFHMSEFCLVFFIHRDQLSWSSVLMSPAYAVAMTFSIAEYVLFLHVFPELKRRFLNWTIVFGIAGVVLGELIRKSAWLTARRAFTHCIQFTKRPGHTLVTYGVYGCCRHPGYAGWFLWALSTQILLANPVSFVVFSIIAWRFFNIRIQVEDNTLNFFFGAKYRQYKGRTWSGIPFVP